MPPPAYYDPTSPNEQPLPLPAEESIDVIPGITLLPPRTRRGYGPGMIMFLPPLGLPTESCPTPLDPPPPTKWAEEGFAVLAAVVDNRNDAVSVERVLEIGAKTLLKREDVDVRDKIGILVYDQKVLSEVITNITSDSRFVCIVSFGGTADDSSVPLLSHLTKDSTRYNASESHINVVNHAYNTTSPLFVHPDSTDYHGPSAALAHTRSLVFLRKHLGGPHFDLEKIWNEHCFYEFEVRSVTKTMSTMVAEPYVNHVPTLMGGIGRKNLTAFYRDHFIFSNPMDTTLETLSRTVGPDRVVDEFIFVFTHDRQVDWLLPGVPPTHKKLSIPMLSVVNIRGDRLYHEHIWWDQAGALLQAGILPTHVPHEKGVLRLPVSGVEAAQLLINENDGATNAMLGEGWGVKPS